MGNPPDPAVPAGAGIDSSVPHSARIWNYWLGGKDHFEVDREAGDAWAAVHPHITVIARETRAFLQRVVHFLTAEAGIRQFLDVGTGLPTAGNTHDIAQHYAPQSRVVYVDNDPLVLAHARALLTSTPEGATHYLHADMHDTAALLDSAAEYLDFDQPVAVLFMGVLGHIPDLDQARALVRELMNRMPSGSYLAIADGIDPATSSGFEQAEQEYADTGATPYRNRGPDEVASFFDGLDWVSPGFVHMAKWRPTTHQDVPVVGTEEPVIGGGYGAVARKP